MGVDVSASEFSEKDFEDFKRVLRKETASLKGIFDRREIADCGKVIGLELETWLTNEDYIPTPHNREFLEELDSPMVVPELSKFNTEINAPPAKLESEAFRNVHRHLTTTWDDIQTLAQKTNRKMLMIGSVPTLRDQMFTTEYMSELERYKAFNQEILRIRNGHPVVMDIKGMEHLHVEHNDIMLEAAATSLQIHFQAEPDKIHHYYNASIIASAPMAAITANTPYMFGRELWQETRIPIFEQSLDLPGYRTLDGRNVKRVTLGGGYVKNSMMELFLENIDGFPVLLPILYENSEDPFAHIRVHNGSIWRWNRPILDRSNGKPTMRVEHRVPSAGPTVLDVVGNMAFFIGLTHEIARQEIDYETGFPFKTTHDNFYAAAKDGLCAQVNWGQGATLDMQQVLFEKVYPMARAGLVDLGINENDIKLYLDEVILPRIQNGQTGSNWQKSWIATHGTDFQGLTEAYFNNQESDEPVCRWIV